VMKATRAGMGCGSCKSLVGELVDWFCGGVAEEDPSVHYYVPGIPMTKPELVKAVREQGLKSVSSVFAVLAGGIEDANSKPALASMLATIWADEYDDERDARFINDRVHGNIQKDGTFSVMPEMPGGVCTPAELRRIAEVAEEFNVPLVKVTGGQRIDLVGVAKSDLPAVWQALDMPAGGAWGKSYRTCKSCIGTDFCRFGLGDSMGLAKKIEARFRGLDTPGKMKLATAGCPRNCSEAMVKDVGAVAIGDGKWELYIGGGAGAHVRKGDLMCTVETEADVLLYTGRFMQYYRENAKYKERSYTFVQRVGLDRIRAVVMEDSDGIADALDKALEKSIAATVDPWTERAGPKTVNQFEDVLEAEDA
jgi:nitrite reductase (NADH) large subunit